MPEIYRKTNHAPVTARGFLLYLLAAPLLPAIAVSVFRGDGRLLVLEIVGLVLLIAGATVNRVGLKAEAEYRRRKVAAAPALPNKLIGALLTGLGAGVLSAFALGNGLLFGGLIGGATLLGCLLSYGPDPRRDKVAVTGSSGYTTEEVVQAIREAEHKIEAIEKARGRIANAELKNRLKRIAVQARRILGIIEDDPRDLRRARKFLNTYLDGARRVTEGYAETHRKSQNAELDDNFRNVLVTIEDVFTEQHDRLLENDVLDLDVQIEVLSTQLKREGVI